MAEKDDEELFSNPGATMSNEYKKMGEGPPSKSILYICISLFAS